MPRKPKTDHPLRNVRQAAGLTQPQLATRVGVSKGAIEQIENGKKPMSRQLAYKVRSQLGCELTTTNDGQWGVSDKLLREDNRWAQYTREDFLAHEESRRAVADDVEAWSKGLAAVVRLLLGAAARSGQLSALTTEVEDALAGWLASYELDARIRGMLEDGAMDTEQAARLADLLKVRPVRAGLEYRRHCDAVAAREAAEREG